MEKIIFDLVGVITKEIFFATKVLFPEIRGRITYNEFKKRYILYCVGNISNIEFWENILDLNSVKDFERRFFRNKVKCNIKVVSLIKKLNQDGFAISLASEMPQKWGDVILKNNGIGKTFKRIYYSSNIKHTKPFLKFYDRVFRNLVRHNEEKTYYVDDTIDNLMAVKKNYPKVKTILYGGAVSDIKLVDFHVSSPDKLKKIFYDKQQNTVYKTSRNETNNRHRK